MHILYGSQVLEFQSTEVITEFHLSFVCLFLAMPTRSKKGSQLLSPSSRRRSHILPPVSPSPSVPRRRGSVGSNHSERLSVSQGTGHCSTSSEDENESVTSLVQGSVAAGSVASSTGSRNYGYSNAQGLELPYQKQLLDDVKEYGGLEAARSAGRFFSHCIALDDDKDRSFYGEPRSKARFRAENKIKHWRALKTDEYDHLLNSLGITPSRYRARASDSIPAQVTVPRTARKGRRSTAVPDAAPSSQALRPVSAATLQGSQSVRQSKSPKGHPKSGDFHTYRDTQERSSEDEEDKPPSVLTMESRIKIVDGVVTGMYRISHCPWCPAYCHHSTLASVTLASYLAR